MPGGEDAEVARVPAQDIHPRGHGRKGAARRRPGLLRHGSDEGEDGVTQGGIGGTQRGNGQQLGGDGVIARQKRGIGRGGVGKAGQGLAVHAHLPEQAAQGGEEAVALLDVQQVRHAAAASAGSGSRRAW
jgi:hypothetical protein